MTLPRTTFKTKRENFNFMQIYRKKSETKTNSADRRRIKTSKRTNSIDRMDGEKNLTVTVVDLSSPFAYDVYSVYPIAKRASTPNARLRTTFPTGRRRCDDVRRCESESNVLVARRWSVFFSRLKT